MSLIDWTNLKGFYGAAKCCDFPLKIGNSLLRGTLWSRNERICIWVHRTTKSGHFNFGEMDSRIYFSCRNKSICWRIHDDCNKLQTNRKINRKIIADKSLELTFTKSPSNRCEVMLKIRDTVYDHSPSSFDVICNQFYQKSNWMSQQWQYWKWRHIRNSRGRGKFLRNWNVSLSKFWNINNREGLIRKGLF